MAIGESMGIRKVYRNKGLEFVDMDLEGKQSDLQITHIKAKGKSTDWLAFVKDRVNGEKKCQARTL